MCPSSNAGRLHEMVPIEGRRFLMGSEDFYPEERPVRPVDVGDFWIDPHQVTNAQFAQFVDATGYVTVAERPLDPADYPDAMPELLHPGGLVFQGTTGPVPLDDVTRWWTYTPGASWRTPLGPTSDVTDRDDHPVVQIAYEDAEAYAAWRGARLPTETEWELAARGGLEGASYCWGQDPYPDDTQMANTWQGEFPWQNLVLDGYPGTSPVGSFPPNGLGLFDMAGNIWEWTSDAWSDHREPAKSCCSPTTLADPSSEASTARFERKVIKGGSHLCSPNYCLRFRPAARQPEAVDTSTCHIGFRCVADTSV